MLRTTGWSAFIGLLFAAQTASACSCTFGGAAPCQEYWRVDAVFAGTVVSSGKITVGHDCRNCFYRRHLGTLGRTHIIHAHGSGT